MARNLSGLRRRPVFGVFAALAVVAVVVVISNFFPADKEPRRDSSSESERLNAVAEAEPSELSRKTPLDEGELGARSAPLRRLGGVSEQLVALDVGPNGDVFGSASTDGILRVWNADGDSLFSVEAHNGLAVSAVAFFPDGRSLISGGGDSELRMWNLQTGAQDGPSLQGHEHPVTAVSVSSDGRLIASSGEETRIFLWESSTGRPVRILNGHRNVVSDVSFGPGGALLASADASGQTIIWNAADGSIEQMFRGDGGSINKVRFSNDGRYLVTGADDGQVVVWDVASGSIHRNLDGHASSVVSIAVGPGSSIVATAALDNSVMLWELETGLQIGSYLEPSGAVHAMAFAPDGNLLTGSVGHDVMRRDPMSGLETSRWSLN